MTRHRLLPRPGKRQLLVLGCVPSPPLFASAHLNSALWHFGFSRLAAVNDQLLTGGGDLLGWQFAAKAARSLPGYAVRINSLKANARWPADSCELDCP